MTVCARRPATGVSQCPLFLLLPSIFACGGEGVPQTPAFEVLDSAGVEIVTAHRSLWRDGQAWTVSASPILEIGQMGADPAYELFRVRGVVRLSDGQIVVGEAGASELRYFEPDGQYVRTVGRAGEGPGEFRSLFGIYARGDTVFAYDYRLSRVTLFGADGDLLDEVTLGRGPGRPLALYPFRDGFLGVTWGFPEGLNEEFTYSRRPSVFRVFGADGVPAEALDELPAEEMVTKGQTDGAATTTISTRPLMGHSLHQAMEELDDAETASWRSSVLEIAELRPAPDIRPAYGRFVADPEGYLWLAPYRPAAGQPVPWLVVEVDGSIMGDVATRGIHAPGDRTRLRDRRGPR